LTVFRRWIVLAATDWNIPRGIGRSGRVVVVDPVFGIGIRSGRRKRVAGGPTTTIAWISRQPRTLRR
jgi:hypothetical protein